MRVSKRRNLRKKMILRKKKEWISMPGTIIKDRSWRCSQGLWLHSIHHQCNNNSTGNPNPSLTLTSLNSSNPTPSPTCSLVTPRATLLPPTLLSNHLSLLCLNSQCQSLQRSFNTLQMSKPQDIHFR